jgi:phosphonate dehydrogenase
MSKPRVVISSRAFPETLEMFPEHFEIVANQTGDALLPSELAARCADADALMAFMPDTVDAAFLDACPRLKIVGCALKGFDNFDVEACTARNVWVSIVPDLLTDPTAELAIGLTIGIGRNMLAGDRTVRSGFSGWRPMLYGAGLAGATVGILGMGAVGQAIARRLQGFDVTILYTDIDRLDDAKESALGLNWRPTEDLQQSSDFLIVATPLTAQTRHLIDTGFIAALKPGAYLVNPARGSVVDELAVADALDSRLLAGYAADVFEFEDWALADRPRHIPEALLANRAQTFFTPHIGSAVTEVRKAIERDAAENILAALAGNVPHGAINSVNRQPGPA